MVLHNMQSDGLCASRPCVSAHHSSCVPVAGGEKFNWLVSRRLNERSWPPGSLRLSPLDYQFNAVALADLKRNSFEILRP